MRSVRLGLAQINTTVGDIDGNIALIQARIEEARQQGCQVVAFPELAVTGYPPEDLVLRRSFCEASRNATETLAGHTNGLIAVVGFIDWMNGDPYNAAAVFADGAWVDTYHKRRLPNYGVFDEERYFAAGLRVPVYRAGGFTFGVSICEDIWFPGAPLDVMALGGAELCININASPYHRGKARSRERMIATRASDNIIAIAYLNSVGGQDELVFDGASMVANAEGVVVARGAQFREELVVVDVDLDEVAQQRLHDPRRRAELRDRDWRSGAEYVEIPWDADPGSPGSVPREPLAVPKIELMEEEEEVWEALVLATRDYLRKTGFTKAIVSVSGGIDSAVVTAIAVDALGPENVMAVSLPSRYSSQHSQDDAQALAENLGIQYLTIPIEPAHAAMLEMLADVFEGTEPGTAEENLQARQRGNVIMTLSNKFGSIVLSCGNKSEMATGYATLYGDMAGGYAVIKDVPKLLVYRLARWRNDRAGRELIPESTIYKPPSAELRPDQVDQDSLPPYEILDPILEAYVEDDRTIGEIVAMGFDEAVVRRIVHLVDVNEYKRRQAAPGVKITPRAFGRDRRLPMAAKVRQ